MWFQCPHSQCPFLIGCSFHAMQGFSSVFCSTNPAAQIDIMLRKNKLSLVRGDDWLMGQIFLSRNSNAFVQKFRCMIFGVDVNKFIEWRPLNLVHRCTDAFFALICKFLGINFNSNAVMKMRWRKDSCSCCHHSNAVSYLYFRKSLHK